MTTTKPAETCGYVPVSNLMQAGVAFLREYDKGEFTSEVTEAFRKALREISEARQQATDLDHVRKEAAGYSLGEDGDVDIIGDWTHHNGEPAGDGGGHWVDAWVWVEDPEPEDQDE